MLGEGGKVKLADFGTSPLFPSSRFMTLTYNKGCSRVVPKLNRKQKRLTITGTRDW